MIKQNEAETHRISHQLKDLGKGRLVNMCTRMPAGQYKKSEAVFRTEHSYSDSSCVVSSFPFLGTVLVESLHIDSEESLYALNH